MIEDINRIKRKISFRLRKKITGKYVIIESDDWGLERARDSFAVQQIIEKYSEKNISRWTKDALETEEDLSLVFDLFDMFRNKFQNAPVITANFITHNLDYSSPNELKFKPISEGYNFGKDILFNKYQEGMDKGYFMPQLHGFSHYNTHLLKKDFHSCDFSEDFAIGFPLAKSTIKSNLGLYRAECFDPFFQDNLQKASAVFFDTFGYHSKTFIPPNYLYSNKHNSILATNHIQLLQASSHFLCEKGKSNIRPYLRKSDGLIYSLRNARLDVHKDYDFLANNCIKQIEGAFSNDMPAVIDIHRVNFAGSYSAETRLKTIEELNKVLLFLSKNHPDTIFISSYQLIY